MNNFEKQTENICHELADYQLILTDKQKIKLKDWLYEKRNQEIQNAAIGGRWTFELTPTGLGLCLTIRDNATREEIDLTETDDW